VTRTEIDTRLDAMVAMIIAIRDVEHSTPTASSMSSPQRIAAEQEIQRFAALVLGRRLSGEEMSSCWS
jgi:hypothetical protein